MHKWSIPVLVLLTTSLLGMSVATPMMLMQEPSGRPPRGPLERTEPRLYEVAVQVSAQTHIPHIATERKQYNLQDAPIVLPIIFNSTYSAVDVDSLSASLWLDNTPVANMSERTRLDSGFPFHTHLATIIIDSFVGQTVRWEISFRTQVWSSRIDDAAAARIAWPTEFPREVADGLRPQPYIESDHEIFQQAVKDAAGDRLRLVPPYLAAKELVRYCINNIRTRGNLTEQGMNNVLRGINVQGALQTATTGLGSPADLVCVCIATLRAAGIPARPVIGIERRENLPNTFAIWAEFYLPEAGWVPFDPIAMAGKGIRTRDIARPWPEFGTMSELNRAIPLSFHFIAPAQAQSPRFPGVWGWDPRPGGDPGSEQVIQLKVTSRGRVQEQR